MSETGRAGQPVSRNSWVSDSPARLPATGDDVAHAGDPLRRAGRGQLGDDPAHALFDRRVERQLRVGCDQLQLTGPAGDRIGEHDERLLPQLGRPALRVERQVGQIAYQFAQCARPLEHALGLRFEIEASPARDEARSTLGFDRRLVLDRDFGNDGRRLGKADQVGVCRAFGSAHRRRGLCAGLGGNRARESRRQKGRARPSIQARTAPSWQHRLLLAAPLLGRLIALYQTDCLGLGHKSAVNR